eukprot:772195-Karenia_brevis.AAC.1
MVAAQATSTCHLRGGGSLVIAIEIFMQYLRNLGQRNVGLRELHELLCCEIPPAGAVATTKVLGPNLFGPKFPFSIG